jgi:hypothetical protein
MSVLAAIEYRIGGEWDKTKVEWFGRKQVEKLAEIG